MGSPKWFNETFRAEERDEIVRVQKSKMGSIKKEICIKNSLSVNYFIK